MLLYSFERVQVRDICLWGIVLFSIVMSHRFCVFNHQLLNILEENPVQLMSDVFGAEHLLRFCRLFSFLQRVFFFPSPTPHLSIAACQCVFREF
jgi:hypothetical protein